MNTIKVGTAGLYQVEIVRGDGRRDVVVPWQENLITNWGMDHMSSKHNGTNNSNMMNYIHVGTGSAAPAFSDIKLQAWLGSVQTGADTRIPIVPTDEEPFIGLRKVGSFARGAVVGNLTELGVGTSPTKDSAIGTRALFRDAQGQPVTIVVAADEQLIITYEMRIYVSKVPASSTVTDPSTGVEYTIRSSIANAAGGWPEYLFQGQLGSSLGGVNAVTSYAYHGSNAALGPITGKPTGTEIYGDCDYKGTLSTDGSWSVTSTITIRLSTFNGVDVKCFKVTESSPSYFAPLPWQVEFTPTWRKTQDQTVQFDLRLEVARK